jgi:hypothetical protein
MSIEEKLITIAENQEKVYNAGYEKGKAEGGDNYYDTFWDTFQNNGSSEGAHYMYAFSYNRFSDKNFNPKYDIICSAASASAERMFYNNSEITSINKTIDVTKTNSLGFTFGCYRPSGSTQKDSAIETIKKLIVNENNTFSSTFVLCSSLKSLTIEGSIGNSISLQWSPLNKESILSVLGALAAVDSTMTCTFKKTAVNTAFKTPDSTSNNGSSSEEWLAEVEKARAKGWTITLS